MKQEKKEPIRKVQFHTSFNLVHMSNVQNVVIALAMSGYLVNVGTNGGTATGYRIDIYKWV